jgi:O-methyltransferase
MPNDVLALTIQLPLPDGRTLVQGPLRYNADGLASRHNADFIADPTFAQAYALAMNTGHDFGPNLHVEWRIYTACWIASNAITLPGDFVECGVASGMISRAIMHYVTWESYPQKTFWLLDTFSGYPLEQLTKAEVDAGLGRLHAVYGDTYQKVIATFSQYANVRIIKGVVPDTLPQVTSREIAYLHLDCNASTPERAAIETFWDRIVPGGWILMDDYGWNECTSQKLVLDAFAASKGLRIFSMPTGQGILLKPHS